MLKESDTDLRYSLAFSGILSSAIGSYQLLEGSAREQRNSSLSARTVVQQCTHALLQVNPQTTDTDSEWVEVFYYLLCQLFTLSFYVHVYILSQLMMLLISLLQIRDGIVIYVCFYKGATEKIIHKMGKYNDINDSIT